MEDFNRDLLICDCESNEHQIIIRHDLEDNEVYLSIHLVAYGFFRRLLMAFKFLFGYRCVYGHWNSFVFKKEQAGKLREVADLIEKNNY